MALGICLGSSRMDPVAVHKFWLRKFRSHWLQDYILRICDSGLDQPFLLASVAVLMY